MAAGLDHLPLSYGFHEIEWLLEVDMKFCTFSADSTMRFGCELDSDRLVDFRVAGRQLIETGKLDPSTSEIIDSADLKSWLSYGEPAQEAAETIRSELVVQEPRTSAGVYQRRETRILAPLKNPISCNLAKVFRRYKKDSNYLIISLLIEILDFDAKEKFIKFSNTSAMPEVFRLNDRLVYVPPIRYSDVSIESKIAPNHMTASSFKSNK